MIGNRRLTPEQADSVWDILVQHAGAPEWGREDFVFVQTHSRCDEYRFMGSLGAGGKFWTSTNHEPYWYVTAYREDTTTEQARMIAVTNAALAGLRAAFVAEAAQ